MELSFIKVPVPDIRFLARVDIPDTTRKLARPGIPSTHGETLLKRVLLVLEGELNESLNEPVRQIWKVSHAVNNTSIFFLATGANKILSSESLVVTGNPLMDLSQHGVLDIPEVLGGEGCRIQQHAPELLEIFIKSKLILRQKKEVESIGGDVRLSYMR